MALRDSQGSLYHNNDMFWIVLVDLPDAVTEEELGALLARFSTIEAVISSSYG